jgi:hypothetical protein
MEIAALLALGGAGYFLTQQTTPNSKQIARKELDRRPTSLTEHFADASKAAPGQQASMGRVKDAQGDKCSRVHGGTGLNVRNSHE